MLNVVRLGVQEHLLVHLGVLGDPVVVQGEGGREGDDGGGGGVPEGVPEVTAVAVLWESDMTCVG